MSLRNERLSKISGLTGAGFLDKGPWHGSNDADYPVLQPEIREVQVPARSVALNGLTTRIERLFGDRYTIRVLNAPRNNLDELISRIGSDNIRKSSNSCL